MKTTTRRNRWRRSRTQSPRDKKRKKRKKTYRNKIITVFCLKICPLPDKRTLPQRGGGVRGRSNWNTFDKNDRDTEGENKKRSNTQKFLQTFLHTVNDRGWLPLRVFGERRTPAAAEEWNRTEVLVRRLFLPVPCNYFTPWSPFLFGHNSSKNGLPGEFSIVLCVFSYSFFLGLFHRKTRVHPCRQQKKAPCTALSRSKVASLSLPIKQHGGAWNDCWQHRLRSTATPPSVLVLDGQLSVRCCSSSRSSSSGRRWEGRRKRQTSHRLPWAKGSSRRLRNTNNSRKHISICHFYSCPFWGLDKFALNGGQFKGKQFLFLESFTFSGF